MKIKPQASLAGDIPFSPDIYDPFSVSVDSGLFLYYPLSGRFWISEELSQLYKLPKNQWYLSDSFFGRVHKDDIKMVNQTLEKAIRSERFVLIFRIIVDEQSRWIYLKGMYHKESPQPFFSGNIKDISKLESLDNALSPLLEFAAREREIEEEYLRLAHDLKTPLSIIASASQALLLKRDHFLLDENRSEYVEFHEYIQRNANVLLGMISDYISSVSAASYQSPTVSWQNVDLNEIVSELAELCEPYALSRGISLTFTKSNRDLKHFCDYKKIQRAILNLISNAIKNSSSDKNSTIALSLTKDDKGTVFISVTDNGVGISKRDQKSILESRYTHFTLGSKGLGLQIVKLVCEQHFGSLSIESEPRKGSKFTLALPKHESESMLAMEQVLDSPKQLVELIFADLL